MIAEALAIAAAALSVTGEPTCAQPVQRVGWDGGTLTVVATRCGRELGRTRPGLVLRAAGGGRSRTLRLQLQCHAYFAAFKPEWHLETERPAVSWPELVLAACNPPAT